MLSSADLFVCYYFCGAVALDGVLSLDTIEYNLLGKTGSMEISNILGHGISILLFCIQLLIVRFTGNGHSTG